MQRGGVVLMQQADGVKRLLGLEDPLGGAGFGKKVIQRLQENIPRNLCAAGNGASHRLVGQWRCHPPDCRRGGIRNIDGAGGPTAQYYRGISAQLVRDAVALQPVDGAPSQQIQRAGRRWRKRQISHHIDIACEGGDFQG